MAIKILSIDDEQDMEMLILQKFRKQIRKKQYEFLFAHNGIEALEVLHANTDVDLILSDINMPEMDGLTFLVKLNELHLPLLKTIMVSAYGDMDNIRTAMNRGAFDFVTKPINFEDLDTTITKTITQIEILKNYDKDKKQLTSIQNDLSIAYDIQQSMLPKTFPPFPDRTDFDLHAFLQPAKSVGGDLYDYFLMTPDKLFFILGDVSDKGVPASLFMAITKAIFKSHFSDEHAKDLHTEVNRINKFLSTDNRALMFVTAFVGTLDLNTGEIEYVDAGHEPPLFLRKGKGVEVMQKKGGLALAIDGNFNYEVQKMTLNPGDAIFMYTDGATDAASNVHSRFGLDHIKALMEPFVNEGKPVDINETVKSEIIKFIGDENQFDDITVLTIRYYGKQ